MASSAIGNTDISTTICSKFLIFSVFSSIETAMGSNQSSEDHLAQETQTQETLTRQEIESFLPELQITSIPTSWLILPDSIHIADKLEYLHLQHPIYKYLDLQDQLYSQQLEPDVWEQTYQEWIEYKLDSKWYDNFYETLEADGQLDEWYSHIYKQLLKHNLASVIKCYKILSKFSQVQRLVKITERFPDLRVAFEIFDREPCPVDTLVPWKN